MIQPAVTPAFTDLMRQPRGVQAVRNPKKKFALLRKCWMGQLLTQKGNPL